MIGQLTIFKANPTKDFFGLNNIPAFKMPDETYFLVWATPPLLSTPVMKTLPVRELRFIGLMDKSGVGPSDTLLPNMIKEYESVFGPGVLEKSIGQTIFIRVSEIGKYRASNKYRDFKGLIGEKLTSN